MSVFKAKRNVFFVLFNEFEKELKILEGMEIIER